MESYFKESKKEFIKYIKKNPFCTLEEWDNYAEENRYYSSITLISHIFSDDTWELIKKKDVDPFQYLKELYIIMPDKPLHFIKNIIRYNNKEAQNERG